MEWTDSEKISKGKSKELKWWFQGFSMNWEVSMRILNIPLAL